MNKIIRSLFLAFVIIILIFPIGTVHPATTATITVNSTDDSIVATDNVCTLREAIIAANTNQRSGLGSGECEAGSARGMDTIIIPSGIYTLTIPGQDENLGLQGDLDITSGMTIQGAGKIETIIQGGTSIDNSVDRVFHVNTSSSVHFEGLNIQQGNPSDSTPAGGGILIENEGIISFDSCWVSNNELYTNIFGAGGGIANIGKATVTIANSAITANKADGSGVTFGGGIYNEIGIINIANSTLSYNSTTGSGGALYNLGTAYISNVTMIHNWSDYDFSGTGDGGGIAGTGTTYLKNSVLMNTDGGAIDQYPNIHGNVLSADYNIIANIGDANNFTPADHDIVGDSTNPVDPELGVNMYSSGSHQLLSTSLVLDQIPVESCTYLSGGSNPLFTDGELITRDQRGAPRPNNRYCDIGAREFYKLTVTSTEDTLEDDGECSLREAINTANIGIPSGQTDGECTIPPDGVDLPAGTFTLAIEGTGELNNLTGDLNILPDLILSGAGAQNTIIQAGSSPGSGIDRVIRFGGFGVLEVQNLTIRHGQTVSSGAGIYCINSTLTLVDVSISDNTADYQGGGIYCDQWCRIVITGSSIVGNQSRDSDGGGIYASNATLTIANSTISKNQAGRGGGGIHGSGMFGGILFMSNTTVTSNTADSDQDGVGDGGGIDFFSELHLKNSIIAGNIDRGGEKPDLSNATGEIPSLDYNLIGDIGTQSFALATHDIVGTSAFPEDPQLGELTGTPPYQVPQPGSQVIDAIPAISCTYTSPDSNPLFSDGDAITSDQIGGSRPVDGEMDGHFACDIGAVEYNHPELTLTKSVDNVNPQWTEIVTYTIVVSNDGPGDATAAVISDTLPASLNYVGPLTLHPSGTVLPEPTLPTLADNLTIASGETISLTFAVSFDPGLAVDTRITNTADVVCSELSDPITGSVPLTVAETPLPVYLPLVVNE